LPVDDDDVTLGKVRKVRDGNDVTLVTIGAILSEALKAAAKLESEGINARILSVHTLKPLDAAPLVAAAQETGAIVTIEEHNVVGGLGGAVAELLLSSACLLDGTVGLADCYPTIVGGQDYSGNIVWMRRLKRRREPC
jgi:transketolase